MSPAQLVARIVTMRSYQALVLFLAALAVLAFYYLGSGKENFSSTTRRMKENSAAHNLSPDLDLSASSSELKMGEGKSKNVENRGVQDYHLLMMFTKVDRNPGLKDKFQVALTSLVKYGKFESSEVLSLHFVSDEPSKEVGKTVLRDLLQGASFKYKFPSTPQEWQTVASHFAQRWDFPNCGGAIDGKHVHIVPPPNSGSYYYNYKGFNSIVMLAVVSATYEFLYVDMGKNGRMSDGGVIAQTEFYRRLQNGSLDLPPPEDNVEVLPFIFIADEAFALGDHLMRPFPMRALTPDQRVFNYRLARARRVEENTFGIMASRFRLFLTPIHMAEHKLNHIILACCVLRNILPTMLAQLGLKPEFKMNQP
ncbi:xyloside xylosyltransferase 1 isoform X2 [Aquarana catesbeiana]|uniref:xyloside xylosyltransferase 1 isoform X2 n=1 Tax=Aquarana catesbeiana TaxID=8400 RepID=UPI003CC96500